MGRERHMETHRWRQMGRSKAPKGLKKKKGKKKGNERERQKQTERREAGGGRDMKRLRKGERENRPKYKGTER